MQASSTNEITESHEFQVVSSWVHGKYQMALWMSVSEFSSPEVLFFIRGLREAM